jgi:hypothetical protein
MRPKRILVQFPEDIDKVLRLRAEDNVRSINGEIVHLVRYALRQLNKTETETETEKGK